MLFERFIARRFMPRKGGGFSGPLTSVAVVGIAMGVVVMVMAVSILLGFRGEITGKVVGFGSHITVHNYGEEYIGQETALGAASQDVTAATAIQVDSLRRMIERVPGVRQVQAYATKGGMVKTGDQIYGILFRGIEGGGDTSFFASCITEGRMPDLSGESVNDVFISSVIASRLGLKVGDKMRTYFWQGESYRARAFTVCGIYRTDLTEMDELYVLGDLRQVVRLNDWPEGAVGGLEVLVDDFGRVDRICADIIALLPYDLIATTVRQANPALFSWLDLLSGNISLILAIMCIVCAVAIVSALLIMIFEKSSTIGVLKALGATDASVRRIFIMRAARLIVEGIVAGDAVALILCMVQSRWHLLHLDPESYAMSHVPVVTDWRIFLLVSLGTLAVCLLALLLPTAAISRISPAATVKTE